MKTLLLLLCAIAICFSVYAASDPRSGVWTAEVRDDQLQMTIFQGNNFSDRFGHGWNNTMGFQVPVAALNGITRELAMADASNVNFELARPSGVVSFDGRFSEGNGAGHFKFKPNEAFMRELGTLGYSGFKDEQLLIFTVHELSIATLRGLQNLGYHPTNKEVVEIAIFDITPEMIKEFARLGYPNLSLRELVDLRVGRVDAAYVTAMRDLGFRDISARQLADAAILGVKPEYVREMRAAGLDSLSIRQLTDLKIGHIDSKTIDEYKRAGYPNLTTRELSEMGIQRVTPAFIEELRKLGYDHLTARQLIEMKIFGVTPEYIKKMNAKGYVGVPIDKLLKLKMANADEILTK